MFAPSGLDVKSIDADPSSPMTVAPFGQGYLLVHSRQRITRDGGHSFLAVRDEATHTRIGRVAAPNVVKAVTLAETALQGQNPDGIGYKIVTDAPKELRPVMVNFVHIPVPNRNTQCDSPETL